MFNWFMNLIGLSKVQDELGLILSVFTTVHNRLESFVERTKETIRNKETQIAKHYIDLDIGKNALEKIKHILGG